MPTRVFVISPIGPPGSDVYRRASYALKYIFRQALPHPEWIVHRADEGKLSDSIGHHVIRSIVESDLIIADLTGHNPNVFYELAVAHGFKKPVVHLISKDERLPFDVFDQRTIHYDITDLQSVEEAVELVQEYAKAAMSNADGVVNPLTNYEAFNSIRSGDQDAGAGAVIAEMLEQVLGRLSQLEGAIRARPASGNLTDNYGIRTTEDGGVEVRPPLAKGFYSLPTGISQARAAEILDNVLKDNELRHKSSDGT